MEIHLAFGILSGVMQISSIIPYVRDMFHGTTRPNVVSTSLWSILILISIGAQISSGASWSLILLLGDFFNTCLVTVLCLIGYGYSKYGKVEWVCSILAVISIVAWLLAKQPALAILFALTADLLASIPTIVKTYKDPGSEMPLSWLMVFIASTFGILSTTIFNVANLAYPIYLFLMNGIVAALAFFGRLTTQSNVLK